MKRNKLEFLQNKLEAEPHQDYPTKSRIHTLKSFFTKSHKACFVKRDDELGFGISGCKARKYRMLISDLIAKGYKEAVVIGGAYSNHVLSITQLLIENGITPTLFLKGSVPRETQGNFLFLQMLIRPSAIHWIPKHEWSYVEKLAASYAETRASAVVIPEGAPLFSAFLGALSLPLDIMRNEKESQVRFDHIFLEVGTGYTSIALLLAFAYLEKTTLCHLVLLAETEKEFLMRLHKVHNEFEAWLGCAAPFPTHFCFHNCTIAPSFGSTNQALFDFIVEMARTEGFFLDPIYSSKLFYQTKKLLQNDAQIDGSVLLIHSGGALSLSGFQDKLEQS